MLFFHILIIIIIYPSFKADQNTDNITMDEPHQPISHETDTITTHDDHDDDDEDDDFSSSVDTSRPFSSVKEAVAIFGERLLSGDLHSPSPKPPVLFIPSADTSPHAYSTPLNPIQRDPSWRLSSPSPASLPPSPMMKPKERSKAQETNGNNHNGGVLDSLRKLEAELEKTKAELKLLKERGSETEVALATLNAELHKNMSKLAQAEAVAAGKAAAATKTVRFEINGRGDKNEEGGRDDDSINTNKEEENENKKDYINNNITRMDKSRTLAHMLSLGENDYLLGGGKLHHHKMRMRRRKHKPIIPLVGDFLFFIKSKGPSSTKSP